MKNTQPVIDDTRQLLTDLRALGLEAEKMIEDSAADLSAKALTRLREQLKTAQTRFTELYGTAKEKTLAGARYTDERVRSNPYEAIAVTAGLGILVGFLLGRSSKN